ncbi:MAG: hypothetical protein OEO21_02500 [Candidatus Krumholzibacteria bacterium]|nr:hypothetical protein [Candidatus Krumholzibacteria bacterium]
MDSKEGFLARWRRGAAGFLRWLCAREHLAASAAAHAGGGKTRGEAARWLFAADHLPPAGPTAGPRAGTGSWRWLTGRERLFPDPVPQRAQGPRDSFFAWLFGWERLPEASGEHAPQTRRVAFLSWLLAPERIASTGPGGRVTERDDATQ